jgi:hypothetical protein
MFTAKQPSTQASLPTTQADYPAYLLEQDLRARLTAIQDCIYFDTQIQKIVGKDLLSAHFASRIDACSRKLDTQFSLWRSDPSVLALEEIEAEFKQDIIVLMAEKKTMFLRCQILAENIMALFPLGAHELEYINLACFSFREPHGLARYTLGELPLHKIINALSHRQLDLALNKLDDSPGASDCSIQLQDRVVAAQTTLLEATSILPVNVDLLAEVEDELRLLALIEAIHNAEQGKSTSHFKGLNAIIEKASRTTTTPSKVFHQQLLRELKDKSLKNHKHADSSKAPEIFSKIARQHSIGTSRKPGLFSKNHMRESTSLAIDLVSLKTLRRKSI